MSALIQVVDKDDVPIGVATKEEAWKRGLAHRIVRIMLEDASGRLLLQKRSAQKDIYPGCWDHSAAGHVDAGEDYETAAYRELEEELGISNLFLEELGSYHSDYAQFGHRYDHFSRCYRSRYDGIVPRLEAGKVEEVRWFTVEEVWRLLREHPDRVTEGLPQVMERYYG